MSSGDNTDEFLCATPTLELVSNEETLSKVLRSHLWEVEKAERYGEDGFLTRIECVRCGLKRIAIVSNIEESARRARVQRSERRSQHLTS
jgi:hypothetical protein